MKKTVKTLIALALTVALTITTSVPAAAARPSTKFLSELHMAEADDAATAKKMLTDNGFTVFEKNLNPGSKKVVYLGYKTSNNVEDAITDISVMNMKGGYNITDFELMLEETFNEYREMIADFRVAANEFAANYKAGSKEAVIAYRQLNYYYEEQEDGKKVKMGDYMLAFPENDDDFANILMKGNIHVLGNIRNLLAMGTGEPNTNLVDKIKTAAADPAVYEKSEYYEDAKLVYETIMSVNKDISETREILLSIQDDQTLTDQEKEEMSEQQRVTISKHIVFKETIESLPLKDTTCGEYVASVSTQNVDYSMFYPIIDAMTEGQRALISFGQLMPIFIYDVVEMGYREIETALSEIEQDFKSISVYAGTDLDLYEGSFAVTTEALRHEAATGEAWAQEMLDKAVNDMAVDVLIGVGGLVTLAVSTTILVNSAQMASKYADLTTQLTTLAETKNTLHQIATASQSVASANGGTLTGGAKNSYVAYLNAKAEYTKVENALNSLPAPATTTKMIIGSSIGVAIGALIIAYSVYSIVDIVNSYKVEYTDIPSNMVDCIETEYGDRYIRYSVVNSYYESDGQVKSRAGDTNGYDGDQWNALYYTKNYEAGKCVLASADWPTTDNDYGKYTPVHKFGESVCFDLNKYGNGSSEIYLAFQTSNAKKAAEAEVPSVVGSLFTGGMIAASGITGIGLGMCIMGFIKRKKKKESQ